MNALRILHVNIVQPRSRLSPEQLFNAWPTLVDTAAAVRRAGYKTTVLQAFHCDAELDRDDVKFHFVAEPRLPGRLTGFMPGRLARAAIAARPDVIHVHGLDFAWHIRRLCKLDVPVLVQDHASPPGVRRWRRRWGLARAAGIAFTDARQADPFLRPPIFSVPESSTHFTPGDQVAARRATGLAGDPTVLWVGRLDANKDPLTILEAVARAAPHLPDLQLWCCYHEEPLLEDVRARLAADPDLRARVHLVGRVPHDRVEQYCRAADFFMLGSHREGSGYALIEAMACGAIPIVSDIPSFRALTGEGLIGALAPVGDADSCAQALVDLAARPRDALRHAVIEHFERNLSFDVVGRRLGQVYETLVERAT